MINITITTEKYYIKEIVRNGNSANVRFPKSEIDKFYSVIPIFEDMKINIEKNEINNNYTINISNAILLITDDVKPINHKKKIISGKIAFNKMYVGLFAIVIPNNLI